MSRAIAIAWVALCLLAGCDSPIVGARCGDGLMLCEGECVDPESSSDHCGQCGESCGDFICDDGRCSDDVRPDVDAGMDEADGAVVEPDAGELDDGGRSDATTDPGSVGKPFLPDGGISLPPEGGVSGCGIGETLCNEACVLPQTDPEHCGACGIACEPDQFCVAGECEDICDPPYTLCGGTCVLLDQDWRNCGQCGNVCASGICTDGECADIVAGHLVVLGHDYANSASLTMRRIAGNSLFLATGTPVRALVYAGSVSSDSESGVESAIDTVMQRDGRTWERIDVDADEVTAELETANAFVILPQPGATDDELIELGQQWGLSMAQFMLRGGVVVLFETDSDDNTGTFKILEPANLFLAGERELIDEQNLTVLSPGVGVAVRATREYRGEPVTVRFLDVTSPVNVIVQDDEGEAVVVHRVVAF